MISADAQVALGWPQLIEHLRRRCRTVRGEALAAGLLPDAERTLAERRSREISEARALEELAEPMPFGGITDVREVLARADKRATLEPEELIAVARMGHGCLALRRHLERHSEATPLLAERAQAIEDLSATTAPILASFDADGRLADDASPALGGLRRQVARLQQQLESRARSLVDDSRLAEDLQDRFWTQRDDRYVLPVKVEARSRVRGIVHGTSQSGQTIFVEPQEIVELNNRLKLAECEVADEERRILGELTGRVAAHAGAFRAAGGAAADLDLIGAAARLADDLRATPASVSASGGIELRAARHPNMVLGDRECVANDVMLAAGEILVVSGPNAGGKTVALKTTGLAALMLRAGLHIAADDGSSLPWFESVLTAIGDAQSLERDLSTFSAHLLELRRFLAEADVDTLVLVDELCSATEPAQGAGLAQAFLESLADRRVPAMVTTHYERLKALAGEDSRFRNASVGFDMTSMAPTFRLHLGVPGASGALDVARRLQLPERVTQRAEALIGEASASVEKLLAQVAAEREAVEEERAALAVARDEAARARARAEDAERAAVAAKRKAHEHAHSDAVAALRAARVELDRVKKSLPARGSGREKLGTAGARIDELSRRVAESAPEPPLPPGRPARIEELAPGVRVFVPGLGGVGEIVSVEVGRQRASVAVGSLKTSVAVGQLRLVEGGGGKPTSAPPPDRDTASALRTIRADVGGRTTVRTPEVTLDLRGERVDAALDALDRFIDQSLLAAREVIFVIHGHGTGALRGAVRDALRAHAAIDTWRPGESAEGGDGVTVAWLGDA